MGASLLTAQQAVKDGARDFNHLQESRAKDVRAKADVVALVVSGRGASEDLEPLLTKVAEAGASISQDETALQLRSLAAHLGMPFGTLHLLWEHCGENLYVYEAGTSRCDCFSEEGRRQ